MSILYLFCDLIKHPEAKKIYRDIKTEYSKQNHDLQAKVFEDILYDQFGLLPELNTHADLPDSNIQ